MPLLRLVEERHVPQVFLSYAHEDAAFVDRLHRDLSEAGIPATYDKIVLEVGDSIVDRISGIIHESAFVVAIVSPASVGSRWVSKELSWALSGELDGRAVRVLPAIIGNCPFPPMLADKLFADFRGQYFPALRALLQAIRRATATTAPIQYEDYLRDCEQLEKAVEQRDDAAALAWLQEHRWVIATLVANPRDIVFSAPPVNGLRVRPTLVCWTLATEYLWHLVSLGPLGGEDITEDTLWAEAEHLALRARHYADDMSEFVRACALTESGGPLLELLDGGQDARSPNQSPPPAVSQTLRRIPTATRDRLVLLVARREDHSNSLIDLRRRAKRELGVEIKSYEWLLEALGGKLYRRGGAATPGS